MADPASLKQIGNLSTQGVVPMPSFSVPPLPDRLRKIDPVGADGWQKDFQSQVDNWVQTLNVNQNSLVGLIPT